MAGALKLDKILDWASVASGKNRHLAHRKYVGLPNRRTPTQHLSWVQQLVTETEEKFEEKCPYSRVNYHDTRRWREKYPELFISDSATDVNLDLREHYGVDALTLANYSGYVSAIALRRLELRFQQLDVNSPEFSSYLKMIDKACCRLTAAAEGLSRIERSEYYRELKAAAYEFAFNSIAFAKADPHATAQMKEWAECLMMASLEKLEASYS